jgi:hypothetical protein
MMHRSSVVNSIFSAVAFLESAINELYQDAYDDHLAYIAPLDPAVRDSIASFWKIAAEQNVQARSRLGTTEKYEIALALTHSEQFDHDSELHTDVRLVIRIQNALVHYKPSHLLQIDRSGLDESLQGRFRLNPIMAETENPFFPDKVLGSGCADWCVRRCREYADEFYSRIGVTPNYHGVEFDDGEPVPGR